MHILELQRKENTWTPPRIRAIEMALSVSREADVLQSSDYLYIFRTEPYIDSIYIRYDEDRNPLLIKRFAIHDGYTWDAGSERFFHEHCVKNEQCGYSGGQIQQIFEYCSAAHSEWHVPRYYTKGLRLLDHVYHCMKQNTAKEILYKSGLDDLAADLDEIDEINLLAGKPSDLYDGLPMRVLRNLNCPDGATLLRKADTRAFLKDLNRRFQDLFQEKLNDAQCRYLLTLIQGDLTIGETARLFRSRKPELAKMWSKNRFELFMEQERPKKEMVERIRNYDAIDPFYGDCFRKRRDPIRSEELQNLDYYLLVKREEYDREIRRANRKRDDTWQERNEDYIVRYPQTINDFCREAVYMQNCLLTYVSAMINGDTTILFMRRSEDVNMPFITIEIYRNELMQAYHRFNADCTPEEAEWIKFYCERHGISAGRFRFDADTDELF